MEARFTGRVPPGPSPPGAGGDAGAGGSADASCGPFHRNLPVESALSPAPPAAGPPGESSESPVGGMLAAYREDIGYSGQDFLLPVSYVASAGKECR